MGPCPFRHGYEEEKSDDPVAYVTLQWGHALSGMDTFQNGYRLHVGPMASMGPCPFRHGYYRDRSDYSPYGICFNGAMPFQAWIRQFVSPVLIVSRGFNGAMPFQAWILDHAGRTSHG